MRTRLPGRRLRDRPILGGRSYVGSSLWAAAYLALGLLLWGVGAYVVRDGVDARWLLATLAASCVLVVFRRTAPGAVVVLATLVVAADAAVGPSSGVLIIYGDALYAACVWGRRRLANTVLAVLLAVGAALVAALLTALAQDVLIGGPLAAVQLFGLYALVFASPVFSGLSVREHRQRTALERERARQIERMAELDRRNAVAEERGRVARELHDVIANHLSAIAVQSTAALSMRDPDPERTRGILGVIRDSSLHGLTEMRAMIRVLRGAGDEAQLEAVTPRLGDADRLFADARAAGLTVALAWSPPERALPPGADTAAYRVLQEALTNALRYAAPMRVEVAVEHRRGGGSGGPGAKTGAQESLLVLTVRNGVAGPGGDDGDGGAAAGAGAAVRDSGVLEGRGAGAGLTGMRERVQLLGGRFSAGPLGYPDAPRGTRVWQVRAEIPLAADEGADDERSDPTGAERGEGDGRGAARGTQGGTANGTAEENSVPGAAGAPHTGERPNGCGPREGADAEQIDGGEGGAR